MKLDSGEELVESENTVALDVKSWSAWAPGLEDRSSWRAWADGAIGISGDTNPDVRFVDRLLRRRLGRLSRMAFRVASDCIDDEEVPPLGVFCSRYGEFSRAFEMLSDLAREEPVSPATFSLSVHNTTSSLFSIMRQDTSHSTALAAGEATLEAGFLECWTLLKDRAAQATLLVYSDQVLPDVYAEQTSNVSSDIALALLLQLPPEEEEANVLGLSWRPNRNECATGDVADNSAMGILRLLLKGGDPILMDSGRLTWVWSCDGTAA